MDSQLIILTFINQLMSNNFLLGLVSGMYLGIHYQEQLTPYKKVIDDNVFEKLHIITKKPEIPEPEPPKGVFEQFKNYFGFDEESKKD